jgi:hypothetical protein
VPDGKVPGGKVPSKNGNVAPPSVCGGVPIVPQPEGMPSLVGTDELSLRG